MDSPGAEAFSELANAVQIAIILSAQLAPRVAKKWQTTREQADSRQARTPEIAWLS